MPPLALRLALRPKRLAVIRGLRVRFRFFPRRAGFGRRDPLMLPATRRDWLQQRLAEDSMKGDRLVADLAMAAAEVAAARLGFFAARTPGESRCAAVSRTKADAIPDLLNIFWSGCFLSPRPF